MVNEKAGERDDSRLVGDRNEGALDATGGLGHGCGRSNPAGSEAGPAGPGGLSSVRSMRCRTLGRDKGLRPARQPRRSRLRAHLTVAPPSPVLPARTTLAARPPPPPPPTSPLSP